jgi:hypothetical protein
MIEIKAFEKMLKKLYFIFPIIDYAEQSKITSPKFNYGDIHSGSNSSNSVTPK